MSLRCTRYIGKIKRANLATVSEIDVHAAYRILLGRSSEGGRERTLSHLEKVSNLTELRHRFMTSPEFFRNNLRILTRGTLRKVYRIMSDDIQTDAPLDKLARLFQHIQGGRSHLGRGGAALLRVARSAVQAGDILAERASVLCQRGGEISKAPHRIERLTDAKLDPKGTAVELGCGVGRVTRHLATRFAVTIGYDISRPHLERAQRYFEAENVRNAELRWVSCVDGLEIAEHDFFSPA